MKLPESHIPGHRFVGASVRSVRGYIDFQSAEGLWCARLEEGTVYHYPTFGSPVEADRPDLLVEAQRIFDHIMAAVA